MTTLLTLDMGNPAHGGYCVARVPEGDPSGLGGKVALVTGTLPGERVEAAVLEDHPRHLVARSVAVLTASPDRVPHVWPESERTDVGGADLGHVAPGAGRRWKEDVLADTMRRIGGPEVAEQAGHVRVSEVAGGATGWRTRVGFIIDEGGRFAMRRSHSNDLVPVSSMPLAVQEFEELRLFEGDWHLSPGTTVRAVAPSDSHPVLVTQNGAWRAPGESAGGRIAERVASDAGTLHFRLSAGGFWQSHRAAPQVLVRAVVNAARAGAGARVLELYSGAGLFTVPLAKLVGSRGSVLGLEGARSAVDDARGNLRSLPQAKVERARVDGRRVEAVPGHHDVAVLDPPRSGAGGSVMAALARKKPQQIVYVACDPAALARDLKAVIGEYRIESIEGFDLFPSTHHVETVVSLVRA